MNEFFVPGRVELCGNHTDHNNGLVLAAAVNLGVWVKAEANGTSVVNVRSAGYADISVALDDLSYRENDGGSTALLRGILSRFKELSLAVGGFDCELRSEIPVGSGLSSSAAYEVVLCRALSGLFNGDALDSLTIANISKYAENVYFKKPCGLMDQLACSVGGLVAIDFSGDIPVYERLDSPLAAAGYEICVISAGGGHEGLTTKYAAIPADMALVAGEFGAAHLSGIAPEFFWERFGELRESVPGGALLRAAHFFSENERVKRAAACVKSGDISGLLREINASGHSSFEYLRNVYLEEQPNLALALCLAEKLLQGRGAVRVHGGGFAGTILAVVPSGAAEFYEGMEAAFGKGACRRLEVYGG